MSYAFEMGPIRPPSEATSILLRVTRNCPWNRCLFCHSYRDQKFSRRSVEEVRADIDSMFEIASRLFRALDDRSPAGVMQPGVIQRAMELDDTPEEYYRQVAFWMHYGLRTAFLQDANSLLLPSDQLVNIITHLKARFPSIERITSYARSKTLAKKTPDELAALRAAGLTRLHLGMESGCDEVLSFIDKGVTADEHITAGRNVMAAGFDLSEYYMPGIGGRERWRENAIESARVLSAVNPTFIRLRSAVPLPGTGLHDAMERGEWTPLTEEEKIHEIHLFLEHLDGVTSTVKSDHMMNLLEDMEGELPADRDSMIGLLDRFLGMDESDRDCFIIGRRIGQFRFLSDYRRMPELEQLKLELKRRFGTLDAAILEILRNFI
jgi:radical SAM superfamily enzyme YgiQ (UPF0313 family)